MLEAESKFWPRGRPKPKFRLPGHDLRPKFWLKADAIVRLLLRGRGRGQSFGLEASVASHVPIVRSTLLSRPNKVGLRCPPVRTSVRPQKVSSISMKFGVYVEVDE